MDSSVLKLLNLLRDHIGLAALLLALVIVGSTWIAVEALRTRRSDSWRPAPPAPSPDWTPQPGDPPAAFSDPVVLSGRWLRAGGAATTSDGGCLVYIDHVLPESRSAALTLRVDGEAVFLNRSVRVGERIEAKGRCGTYTLALSAVDAVQANLAIALRNRHSEAAE